MYYLQDFVPDFVLVGKHWGYGYLFHLDNKQSESRRDLDTIKSLRKLNGVVTAAINNPTILWTINFLHVVDQENILDRIREMSLKFKDHLLKQAKQMYSLKTNKKFKMDKNPYTIRGVGALFYTNLYFRGNISAENIEHNRILLKFDCDIDSLCNILVAKLHK
jgi:hypothetical protein